MSLLARKQNHSISNIKIKFKTAAHGMRNNTPKLLTQAQHSFKIKDIALYNISHPISESDFKIMRSSVCNGQAWTGDAQSPGFVFVTRIQSSEVYSWRSLDTHSSRDLEIQIEKQQLLSGLVSVQCGCRRGEGGAQIHGAGSGATWKHTSFLKLFQGSARVKCLFSR